MHLFHTVAFGLLASCVSALPPAARVDEAAKLSVRSPSRKRDDTSYSFTGCSLACSFLNVVFAGKVSFPQSTVYGYQESRYWSQQQASVHPVCRVAPASAIEVSVILLVLESQQCQFAVKSGGHGMFAGASNIDQGVTIDLINLNQLVVSSDKTQVSTGAGNVWYDVYSKLDPMGISVVGGRVAAIGVGGLTLGGGISFFSGRYGWACDNVNNYEVVFADGTIRDVNFKSYPDLYFALRGGGNNFGIVTRFDLAAFPQGGMWGGSNFHFMDAAPALNQAFENFNIAAPTDPYAAVILAYVYLSQFSTFAISADYQYGKPVVNPPILKNFTVVPPVSSTLRLDSLSNFTLEFNNSNPGGFRQTYWALMAKNSANLIAQMVQIFEDEVGPIKSVPGVLPAFVFQPITTDMTSHFSKNGGNALGFSDADGPLTLVNLAISWSNSADDAAIFKAARNIISRSNTTAYSMGLGHPYIYQNYAALEQDVFDSYGAANKKKLVDIHQKYDPRGVFTKLQPGYFKIA